MSAISVAQDQAFAALAKRRGLLDDAALAQAVAQARELAARGEPVPLAQAVVRHRLAATGPVTELVRELSEGHFRCRGCNATYSYEALGRLAELRCPPCGGAVDPEPVPAALVPSQQSQRPGRASQAARKTFGPYELDREVGRGSMGVVYLARRAGFERSFALKVMLTTDVGNAELTARFEREAQLASRLVHPGIVAVIDRGVASGHHYYAMEFCAGETLQARLRRGPVPLAEALGIVRELADAASVAHRAGVVHRDLKPANVIMDADTGHARITDFGLARDVMAARSLTRTGDLVGTPLYMAPEQVRAEKGVDARADVYALGVILYELLTGTWPFVAATTGELGQLILSGTPRPVHTLAKDVPPAVEALIAKAMARSRDDRFPGALELRDALDAVRAAPVGKKKTSGRSLLLRAAVGLLVAAAVAGPVAYFLRQRSLAKDRALAEKLIEDKKAIEIDSILSAAELRSRAKAADAIDVFRHARSQARNEPRAELAFARFLLRRNQVADAVGVLNLLVERLKGASEQALEARFLLGEAFLRKPASLTLAREVLARVALEDETGLQGKLAHARILALDGRVADARGELEAILKTNGDSAFAHKLLARLMTDGYEFRNAVPHYVAELASHAEHDRMEAELAAALLHANRAIEISPDDADACVVRAMVRVYLQIFREYGVRRTVDKAAMEKLSEERKRDLDDGIQLAEPDPDPLALVLRAVFRNLMGAQAGAVLDLKKALAAKPDYPEALVLLAIVKNDDVSYRRAMELDARAAWAMTRQMSLLDPPHADLNVSAALTAWTSIMDERIESLRRENAERIEARISKARSEARQLLRDGDALVRTKAALAVARVPFDQAIAAAPGDPVPALELARLLLGRARPGEALAALDALPSGADPDEADAIRAEALLRVGRQDEAKAVFDRLAAGSSGSRKLLAEAGAFRASGDATGARARAEEAVRARPSDPEGHRVLAEALLMGPAVEPDAARAETDFTLRLGGLRDADATFDVVLAACLQECATPTVMRPETALGLETTITDGWRALDLLAPCARYRLLVGERLMIAPAAAGLRGLARKQLDAAVAIEPTSAAVSVFAGKVFIQGDDVDSAVRAWRQARSLDPAAKLPADALAHLKNLSADRAREFDH